MKNYIFIGFTVLQVLNALVVYGKQVTFDCPDPELLKPCICERMFGITCGGSEAIDMKTVFHRLNANLTDGRKHLYKLTVNNEAIERLEENTFANISFYWINFWGAENLKHIDTNAFQGTDKVTEHFYLWTSPKLDGNNIFDILNKFENSEHLSVGDIKLGEIPANAFKALDKLQILEIFGTGIESIGEKAFFELNALKRLDVFKTSIKYIQKNIFVFNNSSGSELEIGLFNNPYMNGSSFDTEAFTGLSRSVKLNFGGTFYNTPKQMQFLDQKIFEAFLTANTNNTIDLNNERFDCEDCKNLWLKTKPEYVTRILNLHCANGKSFDDKDNFNKC